MYITVTAGHTSHNSIKEEYVIMSQKMFIFIAEKRVRALKRALNEPPESNPCKLQHKFLLNTA